MMGVGVFFTEISDNLPSFTTLPYITKKLKLGESIESIDKPRVEIQNESEIRNWITGYSKAKKMCCH